MKKNKYIIFAAIGIELIGLIVVAIYGGEALVKNYGAPEYTKALLIVAAFILWFISLMLKLKRAEKND